MQEQGRTVHHRSINITNSKSASEGSSQPIDRPPETQQTRQTQEQNVRKANTGFDSEHGHALWRIKPMTKHSGNSVVSFFNGLFQTIIAIGTLGTSVTFSYVVSNNTQLPDTESIFDTHHVQVFLAISWLLFLLSLAVASLCSTLLTFFRSHWIRDWDGEHGKRSQVEVQLYAVFASGVMAALVIGAFIFMCLVVVAYTPVVGWIALGFTTFFGLIMVGSVLWQLPHTFTTHASEKHEVIP